MGNGNAALSAEKFANELWGIAPRDHFVEFFLIQYRPTEKNPDAKKLETHYYQVNELLEGFETASNFFKLKNHHFWNIHPGVNVRKTKRPRGRGRNEDVEGYLAFWVDLDFHENEEAVRSRWVESLEILAERDLAPSCILESGHGIHAYWLLDRPYPVADARPCLAGLQDLCKSDPISDPARVLRMPGTVNVKRRDDPVECYLTEASWRRYGLEAFRDLAIDPGATAQDIQDRQDEQAAGPPSKSEEIERIKKGVREGERNNAAAAYAGHLFGRGLDVDEVGRILSDWNKRNAPPMPEEELSTVIHSIARKDAAKPKKKRSPKPWIDENGKFAPAIMAKYLSEKHRFLSTPIGANGIGIRLYRYERGSFKPDGSSFVLSEVHRLLDSAAKMVRLNEAHDLLVNLVKIDHERVNPRGRDLVNVENGMLDWKTGELLPHDPSHLSTIQIHADWDPSAKSEEVDKFFTDVFPPDCITLAEEFMGYLLIPDTRIQKCFVAIGSGGNGKGTFLKLLTHLLGTENVSSMSIHTLEEDRFSKAGLMGKLANIYHDVDSRVLESTGTIKSLTSGDMLSAEMKFKDSFNFSSFARLVFSGNDFPRTNDRSAAWIDRFIIVPFPRRFREDPARIPDYDSVLASRPEAMSRLLARAVEGLRRLAAANWTFSAAPTSAAALDDYRKSCNPVIEFVRESCDVHPEASGLSRKEFYETYKTWALDGGLKPLSNVNFCKAAREGVRGIWESALHGNRIWKGLQWKNGSPPETSQKELEDFGNRISEQENDDF